jgi:uncharacterized protein (DUF2147 family)
MFGYTTVVGQGALRLAPMLRVLGLMLALTGLGLQAAPAYGEGNNGGAAQAESPEGLWLTASGNAVVRVSDCGGDLCGQIVGLVLAPNEPMPTGWNGAPQCGLTIFRTAPVGATPAVWTGTILDPRNGAHYGARVAVDQSGQLRLRGYLALPIFGQTQTWTRYNGYVPSNCRLQAPGSNQQVSRN